MGQVRAILGLARVGGHDGPAGTKLTIGARGIRLQDAEAGGERSRGLLAGYEGGSGSLAHAQRRVMARLLTEAGGEPDTPGDLPAARRKGQALGACSRMLVARVPRDLPGSEIPWDPRGATAAPLRCGDRYCPVCGYCRFSEAASHLCAVLEARAGAGARLALVTLTQRDAPLEVESAGAACRRVRGALLRLRRTSDWWREHVAGAVIAIEVTACQGHARDTGEACGVGSQHWHAHAHALVEWRDGNEVERDCRRHPLARGHRWAPDALSRQWAAATRHVAGGLDLARGGAAWDVDVRPVLGDTDSGRRAAALEVLKYQTKPIDLGVVLGPHEAGEAADSRDDVLQMLRDHVQSMSHVHHISWIGAWHGLRREKAPDSQQDEDAGPVDLWPVPVLEAVAYAGGDLDAAAPAGSIAQWCRAVLAVLEAALLRRCLQRAGATAPEAALQAAVLSGVDPLPARGVTRRE